MIRYIQIEDSNKIDAEITFKSIKKGNQIYMALENGEKPLNKRVLKSTKENSLDFLIGRGRPPGRANTHARAFARSSARKRIAVRVRLPTWGCPRCALNVRRTCPCASRATNRRP